MPDEVVKMPEHTRTRPLQLGDSQLQGVDRDGRGVEPKPGDDQEHVAGVGVGGDPAPLAGGAPALVLARGPRAPDQPGAAPAPTPPPVLVGSQPAVLDSSSNLVIGGQTVSQGAQIIVGGNTISLAVGGSIAVVNGATQAIVPAPVITVSNVPIVVNGEGNFVASNAAGVKTVGSITTDARGSTVAVIGGTTSSLHPASSGGIGGAVASGIEFSNNVGSVGLNAHLFLMGVSMALVVLF